MLRVIKPGIQTSLQGTPRLGYRHFGMPHSGPADSLSMALANRLVGNELNATCLEITYGGFEASIHQDCTIAITGAVEVITVTGRSVSEHTTLQLNAGDELVIAPLKQGARTYLAIQSGFEAETFLGSSSTYLPAGLGGLNGRVLRPDDLLKPQEEGMASEVCKTPITLRPQFTGNYALRACVSAESDLLDVPSRTALFEDTFEVGRQATRMGVSLTGRTMELSGDGLMKSAPVFPGTIQCPQSGTPIILLCDAQTTGGYPRIAHIARCDRHLLGQLRPGNSVRLLERSPDAAAKDFQAKQALFSDWLEGDARSEPDWLR